MNITEQSKVNRIITENPSACHVFWNHGMFYVGGPIKNNDTIEQTCRLYGVSTKEIIKELLNLV